MAGDSDIQTGFDRKQTIVRIFWIVVINCVLPLFSVPQSVAAPDPLAFRYLRSVHVLRQMLPGTHWPAVNISSQIRNHDTTNALLSHPDKTFVLESVSRDLEAVVKTEKFPESGYFAAQTLALLGRHAPAASAMKAYIAKAPFREEHYLFLVRELHMAAAYEAVITAARQWQIRGNAAGKFCSEERLAYTWGSFQVRGMYREAMEEILSDPCDTWQGQVYFAKSSLSLGDEDSAYTRILSTIQAHPDNVRAIESLWDTLTMAERYP